MAKRTLLDMVQDILGFLSLDDVNAIGDTAESTEVAKIIRNTYFDLLTNKRIPEHNQLFTLTGLADSTKPTIMRIPDTIEELRWIRYNNRISASDTRNRFTRIDYLTPEEFILRSNSRDSTDTTNNGTETEPTAGLTICYTKVLNPVHWTTFDDEYVIFDGYDSTIDSTLTASKTQCYGKVEPTFTLSDNFTPDMDANLFPLLFSVSKAVASIEVKKEAAPAAQAAARGHLISHQNNKYRLREANQQSTPNYGRH